MKRFHCTTCYRFVDAEKKPEGWLESTRAANVYTCDQCILFSATERAADYDGDD